MQSASNFIVSVRYVRRLRRKTPGRHVCEIVCVCVKLVYVKFVRVKLLYVRDGMRVSVCEVSVCERWCVTKLCVKDGV